MIVGRIRTKSAVLTEKVDTQSRKQRRFGEVLRRYGGLQVFVRDFCEMRLDCADERKRESETVPAMNGLLLSRVPEFGRAAGCQKRVGMVGRNQHDLISEGEREKEAAPRANALMWGISDVVGRRFDPRVWAKMTLTWMSSSECTR